MNKVTKTLDRVLRGTADADIRSGELCALLLHLGFVERVRGDHHTFFSREGVAVILDLQPRAGNAKPYQFKQVGGVLTSHGLAGEPEGEEAAEETTSTDVGSTATEVKEDE